MLKHYEKTGPSLKMHLYALCMEYANKCVDNAQQAINDAIRSGNNETKSSAGDKHETGRSLLQLEQEKNTKYLYESIASKEKLLRINPNITSGIVTVGSVVLTTTTNFYIAIAAGKLESAGVFYIAVSPSSPIAQQFIGLKVNDSIVFNNQRYEIKSVL